MELKTQRNRLNKKIKKLKKELRDNKKYADFERRYSKQGQLSDMCCEFDDKRIELINLKNKLKEIREKIEKFINV